MPFTKPADVKALEKKGNKEVRYQLYIKRLGRWEWTLTLDAGSHAEALTEITQFLAPSLQQAQIRIEQDDDPPPLGRLDMTDPPP